MYLEGLDDHFTVEIGEDRDDGSVDVTIHYDDDFKKAMREMYGRQRCTRKLVERFFNGAFEFIERMMDKEWNGATNV